MERKTRTVPGNLAAYWEKHGTPNDVRLEQARKQQAQRIVEVTSAARAAVRQNPHLSSIIAIIAGVQYDPELLEANATKLVEDPLAMEVFEQIERLIAEKSPNVHTDLAELRAMIEKLVKSN